MSLSRREIALAALFVRLQTLAPDFPTVVRFGNWTVAEAGLPSIIMEDGDDEVTNRLSNRASKLEAFARLEVTIDAASDDQIATKINEVCADIQAAIGADPFLGGAVDSCEYMGSQGPFLPQDPGSPPYATRILMYRLRFQQSDRDPRAVV